MYTTSAPVCMYSVHTTSPPVCVHNVHTARPPVCIHTTYTTSAPVCMQNAHQPSPPGLENYVLVLPTWQHHLMTAINSRSLCSVTIILQTLHSNKHVNTLFYCFWTLSVQVCHCGVIVADIAGITDQNHQNLPVTDIHDHSVINDDCIASQAVLLFSNRMYNYSE